jgi:hypothetical protein
VKERSCHSSPEEERQQQDRATVEVVASIFVAENLILQCLSN